MRPFGALAMEMLAMAGPMVRGIVSRQWEQFSPPSIQPRDELLRVWDEETAEIGRLYLRSLGIEPPPFYERD